MANGRYYLLKITLSELEPEIWRRVAVPANITLDKLHDVIQIVVGWQDRHLYKYIVSKKSSTMYQPERCYFTPVKFAVHFLKH